MLQGEIDRLDDPAAAAGRFELAHRPPPLAPDRQPAGQFDPTAVPLGNPLPDAHDGVVVSPAALLPSESLAWQNAIEQLLQMIGPPPPAILPDSLLPAAYVAPSDAATQDAPPPAPVDPGPAYVIESLDSDEPPPLSLDESDLFGEASPDKIDLLSVDGSKPPPLFQGMDGDLFGRDMDIDPISIGKNDNGARTIEPTKEPPPEPGYVNEGYISLIGAPMEIELSVEQAKAMANEHGELFIDGDGDDVVHLTGDWVFVDARPEKGATYYTDASGTLELTLNNTETVLV